MKIKLGNLRSLIIETFWDDAVRAQAQARAERAARKPGAWTVFARLGYDTRRVKNDSGQYVEFDTEKEAQAEAARLRDGVSRYTANPIHYFAEQL
jgi:hypothetical protein